MKKLVIISILFIVAQTAIAQQHACARIKQRTTKHTIIAMQARAAAISQQISHEMKYDVRFVHLNLDVERTNKFIRGNVKTIATVTVATMDTFMTLLHQNHTIDSVRFNGVLVNIIRQDSIVKAKMPVTLTTGSTFTSVVYYKGTPPNGGSAIGSGFGNGTSASWGNQVTWSLSESFVAYHWWPCKQALTDKIDSSWVFITTDSTNKAGSNGLLKNVVVVGNKKRYEWKSENPIDYYLISVAVAKYKEYRQYAKPQYLPNDSILIQNFIYDGAINNPTWINSQKSNLDKLPQVMAFLSDKYGMYPFYKEKYGHCMAPMGGGMEHQTMSTISFFEYYIGAHELGHQWWGDNVTCTSWSDIWINEGFASYTEHLTAQYLDASNFDINLGLAHNNVMSQSGGSIFFTNSDTLNSSRIFDSRLTYDKGGAIIHSLRFLTNNDSLWFNCLRGFQNTFKNTTASAVDFQNYYQTTTGINPTVFFNQWYYGEGFPTFNVRYNFTGSQFILKSTQSVSMPGVTPLFVTDIEYQISRAGKPDTTVRLAHNNAVEIYTLNLTGTVTSVVCDPNNWIINKTLGPARDTKLGVSVNDLAETEAFSSILIGPNPTKGTVTIRNTSKTNGTVKAFDISGKLLLEKKLEDNLRIDLGDFSSGVYFIKLYDTNGHEQNAQKIIRE